MNHIKSFFYGLREMLTAEGKEGSKLSSKRVITFIAFIFVCIGFIMNVGWGVVVEPTILAGMINIVFGGLGVTVGEHLLKKRNGENPNGIDNSDYTDDTRYNRYPQHNGVDTHRNDHLGDN